MRIKKVAIMVIMVFLFVFISNSIKGYGKEVRGVNSDTMKIGGMADITGPLAATWKPLVDALRIYFRNVNDSGGVHGRKIKYILEDDRYSIPAALSAFKKLMFKDRVLALVAAASGVGHTHAIIPLAEKEKVPVIAATTDNRFFVPARRYIFTPLPFYEDQAKLIFEYLWNDLKVKNPRLAFVYPDVGSARITLGEVRNQAKAYGVKLLSETIIPIMAGDCSSQVLNLKRLKLDYIILHGYVANTVAFLRDARKFGLSVTSIVIQFGCDEETVRIAGEAARNMIGINCFASWDDISPGMERLRKITLKYFPDSADKDRNFMQGWFASMLAFEALKNTGRDLNGETLVEGFEKIKDFDTEGICGVINFSPDDHKSIEYHRLYKTDIPKKKLIPLTGWRKPITR